MARMREALILFSTRSPPKRQAIQQFLFHSSSCVDRKKNVEKNNVNNRLVLFTHSALRGILFTLKSVRYFQRVKWRSAKYLHVLMITMVAQRGQPHALCLISDPV